MVKAYTIWRGFQESVLQYVAATFLLISTLLSMVEVVRRYGFSQSFPWQQDVITYGILSGTFLFFGIVQSRGLHLRVTMVLEVLRSRGTPASLTMLRLLDVFAATTGLIFCVFLVWRGLPAAERMVVTNRMAESQLIPLWPFFSLFLAGIALMGISYFFQLYENIRILCGNAPILPQATTGDAADSIL